MPTVMPNLFFKGQAHASAFYHERDGLRPPFVVATVSDAEGPSNLWRLHFDGVAELLAFARELLAEAERLQREHAEVAAVQKRAEREDTLALLSEGPADWQ